MTGIPSVPSGRAAGLRCLGLLLLGLTLLASACAGDDGSLPDGSGGQGGTDAPVGDGAGGDDGGGDGAGEGPPTCNDKMPCALRNAESACRGGRCEITGCTTGWADCNRAAGDGCEADLGSDPEHCGSCAGLCPAGDHVRATCSNGLCGITCQSGYGDCDGLPANGCEISLSTDPVNCNSCGAMCAKRAHGRPACVDGACSTTCDTGWADCNGDKTDGCETNTAGNAEHCGGCTMACEGGKTCIASKCADAPRILIYGAVGRSEEPFLPAGSVVTVANATSWKSFVAKDFASYDLIVIGDAPSSPLASDYDAAFESRAVWGPAVTGRIVITTLDAAYHAEFDTDAEVFLRASLNWLLDGTGTALYASADWGTRGFDYLATFGTLTETTEGSTDDVEIVLPGHPVMAGSTSASLSDWGLSAHRVMTKIPAGFDALVTALGMPESRVVIVRD